MPRLPSASPTTAKAQKEPHGAPMPVLDLVKKHTLEEACKRAVFAYHNAEPFVPSVLREAILSPCAPEGK